MNISKEEKKAEAIVRMKTLGIFPETIQQFETDDKVSISEPPFGAFYWLEGKSLDRVRHFEKEYNALVYMAIRSYTNIGKMDSFLFVSDYKEEWEMDCEDLRHDQICAYVYNYDAPDCSELGCIGIMRTSAAGLLRIW